MIWFPKPPYLRQLSVVLFKRLACGQERSQTLIHASVERGHSWGGTSDDERFLPVRVVIDTSFLPTMSFPPRPQSGRVTYHNDGKHVSSYDPASKHRLAT